MTANGSSRRWAVCQRSRMLPTAGRPWPEMPAPRRNRRRAERGSRCGALVRGLGPWSSRPVASKVIQTVLARCPIGCAEDSGQSHSLHGCKSHRLEAARNDKTTAAAVMRWPPDALQISGGYRCLAASIRASQRVWRNDMARKTCFAALWVRPGQRCDILNVQCQPIIARLLFRNGKDAALDS